MNGAQPDFQPSWTDLLTKVSAGSTDASNIIQEAFQTFHSCPEDQRFQWLKTAIESWNKFSDENILRQFFLICINEVWQYLAEDLSRLNTCIEIIEICIESPHRIVFLNKYAEIFPSFFPDCNSIDLNLLLALQSPIFSYSVSRHPDSDMVCQLWFHSLSSTQGQAIFKDNNQLALSYFKIMNHAFFQISITTTQDAQQEDTFVNAQKAMKSAIVVIATRLDQ